MCQAPLESDSLEARFNEILVRFWHAEMASNALDALEERLLINLTVTVREIQLYQRWIAPQDYNV